MTSTKTKFAIIKPLAIEPAMRISTNVADEVLPTWSSGSYELGQRVISERSIWECIAAGESASTPSGGDGRWLRVRAVNSWAALDKRKFTGTTQANSISYVFALGRAVDAVAVIKLTECDSVRVRVIDPVYHTVYDQTRVTGMLPTAPDWHAFLLGEWEPSEEAALFEDLPWYPNAQLHIDIVGSSGLAIGAMLFGEYRDWGVGVRQGVTFGGVDYSSTDADEYGETELIERFFADTVDATPVIYRNEIGALHRYLKALRATPALYVIVSDISTGILYGKYNDFRISHSNAKFAEVSIQVEALI